MKRGICNAFTLKVAMAALMLLDHLHYYLPPQPGWFHYLGRLVAPVFCFLMTESFAHTRHKGRYIRRLTAAGLLMLAGNAALQAVFGTPISNSILLSLSISAGILWTVDHMRARGVSAAGLVGLFLLLCACLLVEGGPMLPAMALVFYYLRGNRPLMCAVYLVVAPLSVILFYRLVLGGAFTLALTATQMLMLFAVVPILLYNGERGPSGPFAKWFFYLFYPLHIWALYLIAHLRA